MSPPRAALALVLLGALILLGSIMPWKSCPTTPCGGPLQAFSFYSGIDVGFGLVTVGCAVLILAIGARAFRLRGTSPFRRHVTLLGGAIAVSTAAYLVQTYVIDVTGEARGVVVPVLVGLAGTGASMAARRLRDPAGSETR